MKLQFKIQPHQTAAVDAVLDVFAGQPRIDGLRNAAVVLSSEQLLENVRTVQSDRNLTRSQTLRSSAGAPDVPNLDIEMETGTGKTYVYIKTIMELHRRYGWSRFVVVVPSIAIREGVRRSFEITAEHFQHTYGTRARAFVYDSSSRGLRNVEHFGSDAGIQVMIINIQAFNARGKDNRRIYEELDAFQSRRPIDVVRATRPIVILDEPQKIGSATSLESLQRLDALMMLRYSATHRVEHVRIHRLDAVEAYRRRLVKRIAVRGFDGADRRVQIREVIRAHLEKERLLFAQGVKVLSLFFIDEVAKYRGGPLAEAFEQEYLALREAALIDAQDAYRDYLLRDAANQVHDGYFSVDRKVESKDAAAYHLILRDKERLLSFAEPVRFIFSHSALREGWDNPNVFVMGMLKSSDSSISRRQEIGRGLRLAVNQQGQRIDNPATGDEINELTVVTDESYTAFVEGLQKENSALGKEFPLPVDDRQRTTVVLGRPGFWDRINRKLRYRATLDSAELIAGCIRMLDRELAVTPLPNDREYDLLGELMRQTGLTRSTLAGILGGVAAATFGKFQQNPEQFMSEVARLISAHKTELVMRGLSYEMLDEWYPDLQTQVRVDPSVAADLAALPAVAKLPADYVIPTPVGDLAVAWAAEVGEHLYLVVPDGPLSETERRCIGKLLAVRLVGSLSELAQIQMPAPAGSG